MSIKNVLKVSQKHSKTIQNTPKNIQQIFPNSSRQKKLAEGDREPWFRDLGEGFQDFGPQIRLRHAKISLGAKSEVNRFELERFRGFCCSKGLWI